MNERQELRHNIAIEVLRRSGNPDQIVRVATAIEAYIMGGEEKADAAPPQMEAAADNVVDMEQARGKTEKPAEECDCPACQLRRMLMWGLDPSKPGSDRTAIQIFEVTPNGIRPIK